MQCDSRVATVPELMLEVVKVNFKPTSVLCYKLWLCKLLVQHGGKVIG